MAGGRSESAVTILERALGECPKPKESDKWSERGERSQRKHLMCLHKCLDQLSGGEPVKIPVKIGGSEISALGSAVRTPEHGNCISGSIFGEILETR